jgi:hypothetical protein
MGEYLLKKQLRAIRQRETPSQSKKLWIPLSPLALSAEQERNVPRSRADLRVQAGIHSLAVEEVGSDRLRYVP